ncbi:MAG: hypothetical protein ABJP89_19555 [Lentilitoribacter sp.]
MMDKDKFGDFFGRSASTKPKAKKPVGFFEATPAPASKDETKQQAPQPFFATPEDAQQERAERERQKQQKLEAKRRKEEQARLAREEKERQRQAKIDDRKAAKKKKLEGAKAYKLNKEKANKDKAFIRQEEKIIAQQKREDAKSAAQAKKHGHSPRGSRFYSTEARQEALDNFKKYGTTKRPLQPNLALAQKVLDIYAQIEL